MPQEIVFQDNLVTEAPNLTSRFTDAVGFIISASLIEQEIEIDCYLQIYIPAQVGEIVRVVNLGTIIEQTVLINVTDTETCQVIPVEFNDTNLEMALLFIASEPIFLQASVIKKDCTISQVCQDIDILKASVVELRQQNQEILNLLQGITSPASVENSSATFEAFYLVGLI